LRTRVPESHNVPLARLSERLDELPRERPIVVHCASGYRAAIAASLPVGGRLRRGVRARGRHRGVGVLAPWDGGRVGSRAAADAIVPPIGTGGNEGFDTATPGY